MKARVAHGAWGLGLDIEIGGRGNTSGIQFLEEDCCFGVSVQDTGEFAEFLLFERENIFLS